MALSVFSSQELKLRRVSNFDYKTISVRIQGAEILSKKMGFLEKGDYVKI